MNRRPIGGVAGAGAGKLTAFDGEAPKRVTAQVWGSMEQSIAIYRRSRKPDRLATSMRNSTLSRSRACRNNAHIISRAWEADSIGPLS
jgi:hypothetical protein